MANQTTSSEHASEKEWQDDFLKFQQSKHQFYAKYAFWQVFLAKFKSRKLTLPKN